MVEMLTALFMQPDIEIVILVFGLAIILFAWLLGKEYLRLRYGNGHHNGNGNGNGKVQQIQSQLWETRFNTLSEKITSGFREVKEDMTRLEGRVDELHRKK